MKIFVKVSLLLFSYLISAQEDAKKLELQIGFDTPRILVELGDKNEFVTLKLVYDKEQLKKNNLDGYRFEVKVNEKETDIADKFFDLYLDSLELTQLAQSEKVILEIKENIESDRAGKIVLDIHLSSENKSLKLLNKAKYQRLEIILSPKAAVDMAAIPTDGPNQFFIDFVGTANLQANLNEATDEVQGAAGLGVIFERYFLSKSKEEKTTFEIQKKDIEILRREHKLKGILKRKNKKIYKTEKRIEAVQQRLASENNDPGLLQKQTQLKERNKNFLELQKKLRKEQALVTEKAKTIVIDKKFKRFFESLDMEAYINVASSVDSLEAQTEINPMNMDTVVINKRLFGNYVLNPISSRQSVFINSDVYFNPELLWVKGGWITKWISGANFRINASNTLWSLPVDDDRSRFAGALNLRFGLFHEFLPNNKIRDKENRRKYSVRLGLNYTFRELAGDISSPSNNSIRDQFLGTTDTSFSGLEPSFGFRLNNIIAEFSMPMIGGSSMGDIDGLTDTQFLFSIRFVGGFSIKIDGKE
ncbi:MAG: hypothetical protein AAF849_16135 [Bacteroidota bacterium]